MRTAHVHRGARSSSGVADGGAGAVSEAADRGFLGPAHAGHPKHMDYRFCARATRTRLDRRAHDRDRVSLGRGTQRPPRRNHGRVGPESRCHRHRGDRSSPRSKAGDIGHSNRLRDGGDPVGNGLVASLARPGGNVTGLSNQSADLPGKRLELLREIVPGLRRLAIMANIDDPIGVREMGEVQVAVRAFGLESVTAEIRRAEDIAPAFEALKGRADALYVVTDPLINTNRVRINTLALSARLPTMYGFRDYVEAGGLMSYGANFPDCSGAPPTMSTRFCGDEAGRPAGRAADQSSNLVINLKTAKALGLDVPPTCSLAPTR